MAKRKGSSTPASSRARKKAAEGGRKAKDEGDAREGESTERRLDKLPKEIWEKTLDELDENDLFPLALTCRYFRQKQKELVERTRQQRPGRGKPPLTLKTNLERKLDYGQLASADYLRFCSKEKVSRDVGQKKAKCIRRCTAFHGHLPLLQELLKPLKKLDLSITGYAGQYSSPQCLLLLCFGF